MQIKNGVYVPVELDWSAIESYIEQAESYLGEPLKFIPAGNPISANGLPETGSATIGILPENLWLVPDPPVIKAVNVLISGDVILDVDSTGEGYDAPIYQAAEALPDTIRLYSRDGRKL